MNQILPLTLVVSFVFAGSLHGQEWARKMFATTSHDFGTVARGAKVEYAFEFENLYEENVHVASVRSSCGCTTPSVSNDWVETHEKASIVAQFNTLAFTGQKNAVITVVFDQPFYAELQLQVSGFIRTDIVLDPPKIEFGQVRDAAQAEQKMTIKYAGRSNWTIEDVRSEFQHYKVSLSDPVRHGTNVMYEMTVRFKENAPTGDLVEPLILVTDDSRQKQVVVPIEGKILPALMVSPRSVDLGRVAPGGNVAKRLVVRADEPFRIKRINCTDDRIQCEYSDEPKKLHFVSLNFKPNETAEVAKLLEKLSIETDLKGGESAQVIVTGRVE